MDKILDELYDIIRKHITPEISCDVIMEFVMGEENEGIIDISDYYKIKGKKLYPSKNQRINMARSSDWSFTRLQQLLEEARYCKGNVKYEIDTKEMYQELIDLYQKYVNQKHLESISESEIIRTLVALYFLGTSQPEFAFDTTKLKNSTYVSWTEKEAELRNKIELNKITAVYGCAACGKTMLVKNYLKENRFLEYIYIECETGERIREKKVELKYLIRKNVFVDMPQLALQCKKKDANTKLIIKCAYLKADDIKFLNELDTKMKIIVITRTMKIPNVWGKVYISECPEYLLKVILEKYCGKGKYDDNVASQLFSALQYNPYLTELVSKHLRANSGCNISQLIEGLHSDGEISIIEMSKGEKISVSSYRKVQEDRSPYSMSTMLGRILYSFDDDDIMQVVKVSIWTRTPVTKEFLIKVGGFEKEKIEDAINNGILVYTDNDSIVQMSRPLIWAIWTQNMDVDSEKLDEDLPALRLVVGNRRIAVDEDGVTAGKMLLDIIIQSKHSSINVIEYYYSTLKNIIFRYHMIYSRIAWDKEEKIAWETYYVRWTDFLEKTIQCMKNIGNIGFSEWVSEKIYTKYKKGEFLFQANSEQLVKKQLDEFDLKFVTGSLFSESWDEIIGLYVHNEISINKLHIVLDYFAQMEINKIIGGLATEPQGPYLLRDDNSIDVLLEKYLSYIKGNNILDGYREVYLELHHYIKAIYEDRIWKYRIEKEFLKLPGVMSEGYIPDREIYIRIKLYRFLFEWIIDWLDGIDDFSFYYNKYTIHLETIEKFLHENTLSTIVTNLCHTILLFGHAMSQTEYPNGEDMNLEKKLEQWLLTNKKQYCVSDEYYESIENLVNSVNKNVADLKEKEKSEEFSE